MSQEELQARIQKPDCRRQKSQRFKRKRNRLRKGSTEPKSRGKEKNGDP